MSSGHVAVGHPVDVASGAVFTVSHDFELPGTTWLVWRRYYSTDSTVNSWLGRGWTAPYFMKLERVGDGYTLTDEEGRFILFPALGKELSVGETIFNPSANMELRREEQHFSILHWHHGGDMVEQFCFELSQDTQMLLAWHENLPGHRITVQHDTTGRPTRIIQELEQRVVELTYDNRDLIGSIYIVNDNGQRRLLVRYKYDDDRRLVEAIDVMGNQTK